MAEMILVLRKGQEVSGLGWERLFGRRVSDRITVSKGLCMACDLITDILVDAMGENTFSSFDLALIASAKK